jgi:hypothetical protein
MWKKSNGKEKREKKKN